jgi:hypothetical protein
MASSKVLYHPAVEEEADAVDQVIVSDNGAVKKIIEVKRRTLETIRRLAEITGDDYIDHLESLEKMPSYYISKELRSARKRSIMRR